MHRKHTALTGKTGICISARGKNHSHVHKTYFKPFEIHKIKISEGLPPRDNLQTKDK